ncbi:divalent-cation tolerance protein CutA [Marinobacter hydrocarbonoclasticus]|nr:divalent-cation tolerance protein CutA [Marinobacter nauticus]
MSCYTTLCVDSQSHVQLAANSSHFIGNAVPDPQPTQSDAHFVVLCTCPDEQTAEQLAQHLLSRSLVACVNLIPGITSLYHWQGELCRDQEVQLVLKTRAACLPELEACIKDNHPYEVPEILALPVDWGHRPYLEWINQHCQP